MSDFVGVTEDGTILVQTPFLEGVDIGVNANASLLITFDPIGRASGLSQGRRDADRDAQLCGRRAHRSPSLLRPAAQPAIN